MTLRSGKAGKLVDIFWSFCKIGPITFGGGYAMIPAIEREVVQRRGWIAKEEMEEALSIAGSAPGGIGVNAAAFIGFKLAGVRGAVAGVCGIALPTFLIMFTLVMTLGHAIRNQWVEAALEGVHGAILGLIAVAAYRMGTSAVSDKTTFFTMLFTVLILFDFHLHPAILIAGGIATGILAMRLKRAWGHPEQGRREYFFRED